MYVKVEPNGCCERKGLVQIRFCMYLEPGDYGYEKHHIQVPLIPEGGYQGEIDKLGSPVDMENYQKWLDSLPKAWQLNPFHNHFIYVEPETSDEEIMDVGKAFLEEAYVKWACDKALDLKNIPVQFPVISDQEAIMLKVEHLGAINLERKL